MSFTLLQFLSSLSNTKEESEKEARRKVRWKREERNAQIAPEKKGPLEEGMYNTYKHEVPMQKFRMGIVSNMERRCL